MPINDPMHRLAIRCPAFLTYLLAMLLTSIACESCYVSAQEPASSGAPSAQIAKAVGTIKTVQSDSITVDAESGSDVTATLSAATKILRVPPGEKDLKNATALQASDLQPGDRVLVRGQAKDSAGHSIAALSVIVMKQTDVAAKKQQDQDEWQKQGVGGLVTNVNVAASEITISSSGIGGSRTIAIRVAKNAILRRYAPGSVNFDDAKPAPIEQIHAGDQLRARGTRNADGSELNAKEVVTGSFKNIAGTITTIDPAANTITVQDAISKSPVVVKVTSDSQMKKLPPEMAQRIATRLKGSATGDNADQPGTGAGNAGGSGAARGRPNSTGQAASDPHSQGQRGPGGAAPGGNGPPDLQRMLSRLPSSKLSDLQKGDVVMIVATEGTSGNPATAITLLAGVEPILTASPNRSASLLSPWSLNASGGEGEGAQ